MSAAAMDHRLEDGTPNHIRDREWPSRYRRCRCPTPIRSGTRYLGAEQCGRCLRLIGQEGRSV